MSEAVAWLMRRGLDEDENPGLRLEVDELTGFPLFQTGGVITEDDVKRFLDENE